MVRWLLLGSMLFVFGTGLQRGWIEVKWDRVEQDVQLPFIGDRDKLYQFSDDKDSRQAR